MTDKIEKRLINFYTSLEAETSKWLELKEELILGNKYEELENLNDLEIDIRKIQNTICRRIYRKYEEQPDNRGKGFLKDNVD